MHRSKRLYNGKLVKDEELHTQLHTRHSSMPSITKSESARERNRKNQSFLYLIGTPLLPTVSQSFLI